MVVEWYEVAFCQWRAEAKNGYFEVWKDGREWKGKYRSGQTTAFMPIQKTLKAIKKECEKYEEKHELSNGT